MISPQLVTYSILVTADEGWSFESIELADQVLKDRCYTVANYYFLDVADGIFETWRDLLYEQEGLYSDVFRKVNLLTRRVWNYGYLKMRFTVDDFCLDKTLAHESNDPPNLGDWNIQCPTHTQNGDLGFVWHIRCTSQQIYTNSRLITELCPAFLPQGIEEQDFNDLPVLLKWREFDFIYQELLNKGLLSEVPNMVVPKNNHGYLHSFTVAILCKA
jgi:hypothetical protein